MRTYRNLPIFIATFATYLAAWFFFSAPIDQGYWNARFALGSSPPPESIVLVRMDSFEDQTDRNADYEAKILAKLRSAAPRKVYLDGKIKYGSAALNQEIQAWGDRISLVARFNQISSELNNFSFGAIELPDASVVGKGQVVVSGHKGNFWKYAGFAPCAFRIGGATYAGFGADLAGTICQGGEIRPDFSVNPHRIPSVSARDLIAGKVSRAALSGKTVIVATVAEGGTGTVGYFGRFQQPLVVLDIAAAAGARRGQAKVLQFEILLTLFIVIVIAAQRFRDHRWRWLAYGVASCMAVFGPAALERLGYIVNAGSTLVVMAVFGAWRMWSRWRLRVLRTGNSGLPNFVALGEQTIPAGFLLVVAVIGRYEEFLATLPKDLHGECARQIARRFSVGCGTAEIYHGEGGHFAWLERDSAADNRVEHFEGMRALFSAPLLVGGHMFDTNVHFGIDRNGQFDTLTRLNTALASATEALRHGRTVEQFEANRLANAPWELSLLARIDEGMRNGDIWLAYQPQWEYRDNRISGAEALIRWNDPVRGPIRPDEFILQAERAGRIDALTYWVLEQAITAAEAFNALGARFQMSINLSAQLVDKPSLVSATAEIVHRRGIDCRLLTIEVTETASVYNRPDAIRNLQELRAMGFHLSIDDFGTGEASLCYLADLPSDELKLDRRFVSRIVDSDRERQIVQSMVHLAHGLGQTVVAEGIEDMATFDMLRRMGCDVGQGYYIGRPETFEQLRARYLSMGPHGGQAFTSC